MLIFLVLFYSIQTKSQINESDLKSQLKSAIGNTKGLDNKKANKNILQDDIKAKLMDSIEADIPVLISQKNIIFGSELYSNPNLNFLPQKNIPIPENYVLGIGDEVNINIFGVQEYFTSQVINNKGDINIENFGPINIYGLTITEAESKLKKILSNSLYGFLKNGGSKLVLTLDKVKTINVTLIGARRSGNYNISSLSTVFHLLYLGGGPDSINSYRNIKVFRKNELYKYIDLYEYLHSGIAKDNFNLQNGDVVLIPNYTARVYLNGEIRRKGIFELNETNEKLSSIVQYSGGFTSNALHKNIQIHRIAHQKRTILNIDSVQFDQFKLTDGDSIVFNAINSLVYDYVDISGMVLNPGRFELGKNKRIADLISNAGGLKTGSFKLNATLWRFDSNYVKHPLLVNLNEKNAYDLNSPLQQYDSLVVYAFLDVNHEKTVLINGEVRKPGKYPYTESMHLSDVLLLAGNIKENGNRLEVEVLRKKRQIDKFDSKQSFFDTYKIFIDSNFLQNRVNDFSLFVNDIINVKVDPNFFEAKNISINGEVLYPGAYTLLNNNERISSLIKRAGNVTSYGNVAAAKVFRLNKMEQIQNSVSEQLKDFQRFYKVDTNLIDKQFIIKEVSKIKQVVIDLEDAMANPGSDNDLILENGDSVFVPSNSNVINVEGEVYNKGLFVFKEGKGIKYYMNLAAGFTKNAAKKRVFIIHANGIGSKTKSIFGIIKFYPKISKGASIYVPPKMDASSFLKQFTDKTIIQPISTVANKLENITETFLSYYLLKNIIK